MIVLGGIQDAVEVKFKDPKKKDTSLTFQYWDQVMDKKMGKVFTDDQDEGDMFHCDDPVKKVINDNPGESRLMDCFLHGPQMRTS